MWSSMIDKPLSLSSMLPPFDGSMKIHYFEDGIIDPSFSSVKGTIMVDHQKFQDFDTVIQLYVNFKHS